MATAEDHFIEYKDFHREQKPSKKAVLANLFREISAFANTSGGEIIVGLDDKTHVEYVQPDCVYDWLENDRLTTAINALSDNLIVLNSKREGVVIRIEVKEAEDVISARVDTLGINKGDCFIRENHETVKAKGEKFRRLLENKSLSTDVKLKALRKIVHYKISNGLNHAEKLNIFDSLFVTLASPHNFISTVFESLMMNEFVFGYNLPLSKFSTMQMHVNTMDALRANSSLCIEKNREAFGRMMNSDHIRESFFAAHLDEVLCSPQLKAYILEYKDVIEVRSEGESKTGTD